MLTEDLEQAYLNDMMYDRMIENFNCIGEHLAQLMAKNNESIQRHNDKLTNNLNITKDENRNL